MPSQARAPAKPADKTAQLLINFIRSHQLHEISSSLSDITNLIRRYELINLCSIFSTNFIRSHQILSTSSDLINFIRSYQLHQISSTSSDFINFIRFHQLHQISSTSSDKNLWYIIILYTLIMYSIKEEVTTPTS